MPHLRYARRLVAALIALALVPSLVAAQNAFIGMYLTWNGQPYDGYHATEYAILYYTPTERAAGNPFVIGWSRNSDHGILGQVGLGQIIIDTVETQDPAGGCELIATPGAILNLVAGDTVPVSIPLLYRWCPAGVIGLTADSARGTVQINNSVSPAFDFTDSVVDNDAYNVALGSKAGQFPHGSTLHITATPAAGYVVSIFGRVSEPGHPVFMDTIANTAVAITASFYPPPTFSIVLGTNTPTGTDTIAKGTTKEPMLEFSMNSPSPQTLNSVTVRGSGSGDEHVDVSNVKLYDDTNGNGRVDAGEQLLGSSTFPSNDASVTINVAPPFSFTGQTNLLVTYDFNVSIAQSLTTGAILGFLPLLMVPAMRRRKRLMLASFAAMAIAVGALSSCGGSDSSTGPPPPSGGSASYQAEVTNVNVSGTDHATTLTGHTVTILK